MADKKSRLLYLQKILCDKTDENHPMTMSNIISELAEYGIDACSKTVLTDIKLLQEFGIDIVCDKSRENKYFIGDRDFELPELRLLVDAVASSRFIPKKKSTALIQKITSLASPYQAKMLKKQVFIDTRIKQLDSKVFITVDTLSSAINNGMMISFQYSDYDKDRKKVLKHSGYKYIFSPYNLIWDNDFYYVLGYSEKHEEIIAFRVDRIVKAEILPEKARVIPKADALERYARSVFYMYDGKPTEVTLNCTNDLMRVVIDRFGEDILTETHDDKSFNATIKVAVSPTFFGWVFQFAPDMKIVSPKSVQIQYAEKARTI